jgi:hypothetical protein
MNDGSPLEQKAYCYSCANYREYRLFEIVTQWGLRKHPFCKLCSCHIFGRTGFQSWGLLLSSKAPLDSERDRK